MPIDEALDKFENLLREINIDAIETEEDTRFAIINRVLIEVLGWKHEEIPCEKHSSSGFADYLFTINDTNYVVLEAKRTSKLLVDTAISKCTDFRLSSAGLLSAQDGISQARGYCMDHGAELGVLSSGNEWIFFLAVRNDGKPPKEGRCIVFPSLESVKSSFSKFYDLLSREGVVEKRYRTHIFRAEGFKVRTAEKLDPPVDIYDVKLLPKSSLARDIDAVFKEFFWTMSGESDIEFLAKCFVESRQSHEADAALKLIASNLTNRIEPVDASTGQELEKEIESAIESKNGETVLIIGNKGAGKSTFVDRFFRLVLDKEIREKCLVININIGDSPGDIPSIDSWIMQQLKNEMEGKLFRGGAPKFEDLQGIFFREYKRWSEGEFKALYERDKSEFKIKFGEFIYDLEIKEPLTYIKRMLQNAVESRKLMPCIVFDNTDHFPQPFQEKVFQFSQAIFSCVYSFIIIPITDRTIWQLSKSGPFQSYDARTFYLPVPSIGAVLEKRISFIERKIEDDRESKGLYFLEKGIKVSIANLKAFASCIEQVFVRTSYVSKMIGYLANYDIRRCLKLSNHIITSPTIKIEKLIEAYFTHDVLNISHNKITKAVILGDYDHFKQDDSSFVLNLFSISSDKVTSPIFKLSILRLLQEININAKFADPENVYMNVGDVFKYFEAMNIEHEIIAHYLQELLSYRLVECHDPSIDNIADAVKIKISFSGRQHYQFGTKNSIYVDQMALITPLRDADKASLIQSYVQKRPILWQNIEKLFIAYCLEEDRVSLNIPNYDIYAGQKKLRDELLGKWVGVCNISQDRS